MWELREGEGGGRREDLGTHARICLCANTCVYCGFI